MKAYMVFSRGCGPEDGAALIFAHTAKEAKRMAWKASCMDFESFTDLGIRLMRDTRFIIPLADQNKLKADIPHIVDSPDGCLVCGHWGAGLTIDGLCGNCNEYPGPNLTALLAPVYKPVD